MFIKQLSIAGFRNITNATLEINSRVSVLVGANGQGKTSVLEAMYLLGHNRSFRTSRSQELISRLPHEGDTTVSAVIETADGEKTVAYRFADGRKQIFVNGNRVTTASEFYGTVKIIDFTPDDLFIVKGAPSERRQFLDKILALIDRDYVDALVRYQRALKNRNALLAADRPRAELRTECTHWEETLIQDGLRIAKRRAALVQELNKTSQTIYGDLIGEGGTEKIFIHFESAFLKHEDQKRAFTDSFDRDLRLRTTTFGVHRDDLGVEIDTGFGQRKIREIGSQGQTRTAALALKLAGVEYLRGHGEPGDPIVLLDDVESELDPSRKGRLLEYLLSNRSQIFIATTEKFSQLNQDQAVHLISGGEIKDERG